MRLRSREFYTAYNELVSDEFASVFHGFVLTFVSANPPISKLIRFV